MEIVIKNNHLNFEHALKHNFSTVNAGTEGQTIKKNKENNLYFSICGIEMIKCTNWILS